MNTHEEIGELAFEALTHNSDRKFPMEELIESVYHHRGKKRLLADTLLEAFLEAAGYMGMGIEEQPLPFEAMTEACARAHRGA